MPIVQLINSFNAGELSPFLGLRTNLEKYASGCRILENFVVMPYGGINRRPGTEYLGSAVSNNTRSRLIGFNFSVSTRFVLEFGHQVIRFWNPITGELVEDPMSPGNPLTVATPYQEAELREIQFLQVNDVMYLVHPSHHPRKLSRLADDNWTFVEVAWDWPPMLDDNTDPTTLAASAVTGTGITLTASAATFTPENVGSFYEIAHRRDQAFTSLAINATGTSTPLTVLGDWEFTTSGTWTATINIERSEDGGSSWEVIRTFRGESDRNVTATGLETKEVSLRVNISSYTTGTGTRQARLEAADSRVYGLVKVTGFTSATSVTANVIQTLAATTATKNWAEGAFSARRGFPRTVALHEQRIMYGGTRSKPGTIWGSVVDDFENMRVSSFADAGLRLTLATKEGNAIQWMIEQDSLLIGTSGDEWTLGSQSGDDAISSQNLRAKRQSAYGSRYLRAVVVNDVILFAQRQGRKVRELVYSFEKDGWVAPDLTLLAEHVTNPEIVEVAYQQQPDAIYWAIRGDGQLVGMTYERDQQVVGWHRHTTQGEFESVATIYGVGTEDEVWVSVKRTINGQARRFIERFRLGWRVALEEENKPEWWYVDCGKRVTLSPPDNAVTGFGHLEGETVSILADGAVETDTEVVSGGFTMDSPASIVIAGLPFTSRILPMRLDIQMQDGTAQGRKTRIARLSASFYKCLGAEFSTDGQNWDAIYFRDTADLMDASPPAFTGEKEVFTGGNFSPTADAHIRQKQPLPLTLLALIPKWDVYGD